MFRVRADGNGHMKEGPKIQGTLGMLVADLRRVTLERGLPGHAELTAA